MTGIGIVLFSLGAFIYIPIYVLLKKKKGKGVRYLHKIISVVVIICLMVANIWMYFTTMLIPIRYPISLSVGIVVGMVVGILISVKK